MRTTTLETGVTLSHYRVIGPLGAGGMGEVYKAQDTKLERAVALKILPPSLVRNDERVRRFVQEAKSASSLNHPHIVTIHEIGQAEVTTAEEGAHAIHYIAMELIDGSTLRSKIHDERVDLRTLLTHLAQAAEGLAKAHAAGIVHRDLKPENIMVTRDGFAKVLDFGLAKLNVKKSGSEGNTATAVLGDTREGTILGTVAYMSPEQVQGKVADHRSDIFSFGSILYEAATRRRPFVADSDVDVMHKILHEKPLAIDEIAPEVPAELRRMVRRCMAKDPERRFQSMKDLAIELAEIVDEFEALSISSATRTSGSISGPVSAPPSRMVWGIVAGVALLALAGIAFGLWQWQRSRAAPEAAASFASMKLERLTTSGNIGEVALSPDGKYVAHVLQAEDGTFSLRMRQVSTGTDVTVAGPFPNPFSGLSFSPDGDYLYYSANEQVEGPGYASLFQIPSLGGSPRKILFDVDTPVSFSPDGKRIAFGRGVPDKAENHLMIANADGTGEKSIAVFERFDSPTRPSWSLDGKRVLTTLHEIKGGWNAVPVEVDVETKEVRRIGSTRWFDVRNLAFLPDGSALLMTAIDTDAARSQVWIQPYPSGKPYRVTNDVNHYEEATFTRDGSTIAAVQLQTNSALRVQDGERERELAPTENQLPWDLDVSPSGAVVYDFTTGNQADIGIVDKPGTVPRTLTNGGFNWNPAITGDGRTIYFESERGDGLPHIWAVDADGTNLRQITRGDGERNPSVSDDGRVLVYGAARQTSLWMMTLPGGQPRQITDKANGRGFVSPDGKLVAYRMWAPREGRLANNLRIEPIAGGAPIIDRPWTAGGNSFRWDPKGEFVSYRATMGGVQNLFKLRLAGGEPEQVTRYTSGIIASFDWMGDGKLVVCRATTRSDAVLIREFRRAAP
jgi:serine/threonine protein kinase